MATEQLPSAEDGTTDEQAGERRPHEASGPARSGVWQVLRPLVLRLHFYAGLLIAPFLLVAAVTGLLYAGAFQAEKVVYAHELRVPAAEKTLPLAEQVRAARAEHPEGTVNAVRPSAEAGATTRVLLDVPGLGESRRLAVFVDPYRGEVRGALEAYGSSEALPLRTWIDELHRGLHLGDPGRIYSELAASWLWVVALGGVALWIGRTRGDAARTGGRRRWWRLFLLPERGREGRRGTLSWHATVGVWAAVGLVFLSATGLTWSQYAGENVTQLRAALSWETPEVSGSAPHHGSSGDGGGQGHAGSHGHEHGHGHGHAGGQRDVGPDRVLAAARGEGLSGPVEVTPPEKPGSDGAAWTVKQIKATWPVQHDAVAVDGATGRVTEVLRFQDWPLAAKLSRWGIDAHMGLLFGLVNQIALAVLMVGVICLICWGYRMWWQRRPTRAGGWSVGRAPGRGAWRRVPLAVLVPLVLVTAVVGWFLPLLGIPLLAFLAVDAVTGAVRRRRAA